MVPMHPFKSISYKTLKKTYLASSSIGSRRLRKRQGAPSLRKWNLHYSYDDAAASIAARRSL